MGKASFFSIMPEKEKIGVLLDESRWLMKEPIREKIAGGVLKGQARQVGRRQGQDEGHMGQARFIVGLVCRLRFIPERA